jgi:hypothetical protein
MKKKLTQFPIWIAYFFILLFCYAAISKVFEFENFQVQIAQSPLLSSYAVMITYGILFLELLVCCFLIFDKTRFIGLYGSYILMVLFSIYIYLILNYSEFIPCSCGGILEKMDWHTHLIFNLICVLIAVIALSIHVHAIKRRQSSLFFSLLITAGLCTTGMLIMYQKSEYILKKDNGFQRRFLQHPILKDKTYDLKLNSYYFAGFSGDTLYLGNYTAPFSLTKITNFSGMERRDLQISRTDINFRSPLLEVTDGLVTLYDGTIPIIFEGTTGSNKLTEQNAGKTYFRRIKRIDYNHFVIGASHRKKQIQSLGIISKGSKDSVRFSSELLEKKKEGFFEPDGQLNYDPFTGKVVYVYHYKNLFVVSDRNLKSKRVFRTIDTVSTPRLGLSNLADGSRKLNNPLVVNKRSIAYKGILFIESDRRGKLEKDRDNKAIILDLYSIHEQKYLGSISIPNRNKEQRVQFTIHGNLLYVMIENELIRYRFAQNITQHFISGEAENLYKE